MKKFSYSIILALGLLFVCSFSVLSEDNLDSLFDNTETAPQDAVEAAPVTASTTGAAAKAQVSYVEGEVRKRDYEEPEWTPVTEKSEVASQGKVRTLVDSRAEILLDKEKTVRLAPKTTVDLLKLFKEEEQKIATSLNVEEGAVWANIAKLEDNADLSINSKLTTAAVRGTIFNYQVANGVTQIKVYRGRVEVYNPYPQEAAPDQLHAVNAPQEVKGPDQVAGPAQVSLEEWTKIVLNEMQTLTIGPGDKSPTVSNFTAADAEEQSEWVKWNKMRDDLLKRQVEKK